MLLHPGCRVRSGIQHSGETWGSETTFRWGFIWCHYLKHSVRLRRWVLLERARECRYQMDCVPAAAPSLGGDTARWCADCESGRAAGKPGWTELATEQSHTTETPEDTAEHWLGLWGVTLVACFFVNSITATMKSLSLLSAAGVCVQPQSEKRYII